MAIEMNWVIVTKGEEERISEKNQYKLTKNGYRLYPMNIEVDLRKHKKSGTIGVAVVKELIWKNGQTVIIYELIKLNGIN